MFRQTQWRQQPPPLNILALRLWVRFPQFLKWKWWKKRHVCDRHRCQWLAKHSLEPSQMQWSAQMGKYSSSPGHHVVLMIIDHLSSSYPQKILFGKVWKGSEEVAMLYRQHLQIDNATVPFYCAVNSASVQLLGLLPDHQTLNGALQRFGKTDKLGAINLTNLGLMEMKNIH